MKRYTIKTTHLATALLVLSGLLLGSCEKVFDKSLARVSDSRETLEGVLGDAQKVRGLLSACYAGVPKDRSDIYFWTTFESLTDNCFDSQDQSMGNWRNGLLSPSESAIAASAFHQNSNLFYGTGGSYWARYWAAIRACNLLINNIDNITVPETYMPISERLRIRDEAIILRAFFHTQLIGMYGPLPFMDEILPVDFQGWDGIERPTYQEVATRIALELQTVIDRGIVPMKPSGEEEIHRVPMTFAYGLKSRMLLYNASPLNNPNGDQAKYEAAAEAAEAFLLIRQDLEPLSTSKKRLYNSPMTQDVENVEVVWRGRDRLIQMSNVHGMNLVEADPKTCGFTTHKAGETPTQEIVDCYELKNGALIIEAYDATHAAPTFTQEALDAGYDDVNNPYANRDDRFYRDIMFNGNSMGNSYDMGEIIVWTYAGAKGTGTNGISSSGDQKKTYTGYYYGKDRDPLWYGTGGKNDRSYQYTVYMRNAEIWLNYAESLCGANRLVEACDALDKTRLRANQPSIKDVPDFQLDKDWLMKRIYNERRVELLLENHRFFDVRRWNLISDQNNNAISGMLVEKKEGAANAFTHKRYQMPFTWECHNEKYKIMPIPLADQKLMPTLLQPEAWR